MYIAHQAHFCVYIQKLVHKRFLYTHVHLGIICNSQKDK